MTATSDEESVSAEVWDWGCGKDKVADAVGVDSPDIKEENTEAEIRQDLNQIPYDFAEDNSATRIYMNDSLEHLERPVNAIVEGYRILKPGGKLIIRVPQADRPETNPFHNHHFTEHWFYTFDPDRKEWEKGADWKDKPKFSVDIEINYKRILDQSWRIPFYNLAALMGYDDKDVGLRPQRNSLKVEMVKKK